MLSQQNHVLQQFSRWNTRRIYYTKGKSQIVIFHACAETTHAARSLSYLELKVGSPTQLRTPSFMVIGSGVLLPGVAENPTFPILSVLAYTTGLGYHPTSDWCSLQGKGVQKTYWLDGRKGLSLPLLSSQVDVSDDESSMCVGTTDEWLRLYSTHSHIHHQCL